MKELFDKLYNKSEESFYQILEKKLKENKKTFIVTANPETFMMSENDEEMKKLLLDKETILVPDGIGIVKAARMIDYDIKERITGIDIANKLLELGNKQKKSIYLFGAKQEVIDSMKEVIEKSYPNLKLVGASNGYEKDKDKVFEKIAKAKPDIVLVALGIPLQEKLIYKHLNQFNKGIFVGVGGSFDVISGHKKRAPKIFIKLNLEWLYRILKEPKRLKRFYDSNVKFLFKVKKKDNKKITDNIFTIFVFLILIVGLLNTILNSDDINYYENRTAYKMPKLSISKILDKTFQDDVELAFSDQIPLATAMKKGYNFLHNVTTNIVADIGFKNDCSNRYIQLGESTVSYGCDKNLVYYPGYISYDKESYDNRIASINKTLANTPVDTYIYYIEKDTDINFTTNEKSDIYDYLKKAINSDKIYKYEINSFEEFKDKFYKTDHHWNYKGSYLAYTQLVKILTNDEPLKYKDKVCLNNNFSGSKANFSGATHFYKEEFCVYEFKFPNYDIYINGEKSDYGNQEYHINNPKKDVSYGSFYGYDDGEIIFDNHDNSKENILIVGESYDNAILKLLASHFNKTYSIDLRNYERENNKKFNYLEYLNDNNIDKVLLIGNKDYFAMSEFNLEV